MEATVRPLLAVLAVFAVVLAAGGAATASERRAADVNLAMISPLTGPLSFVGQDNRAGALAAVREINARGGVRGRRIRVTIFDDGSNPSQGVVHMQRIASDRRYLGVIGSGMSSVSLAVAPIVGVARILYISMASSSAQLTTVRSYLVMSMATISL